MSPDFEGRISHGQDEIVLFADVPNAGVSRQGTGTSGNRRHDVRSGKFAPSPGGEEKQEGKAPPANTSSEQYQKMLAAVKYSARFFGANADDKIREFLDGRAENPNQIDIARFMDAVRKQQIEDLIDVLEMKMVAADGGPAPVTRMAMNQRNIKNLTATLSDQEVSTIRSALTMRGNEEEDVTKFLASSGFKGIE